jgi:hypothetical protein
MSKRRDCLKLNPSATFPIPAAFVLPPSVLLAFLPFPIIGMNGKAKRGSVLVAPPERSMDPTNNGFDKKVPQG